MTTNIKLKSIFFNQVFDKKRLKVLIAWVFKEFGEKQALRVVEELKTLGFHNATKAGLSIGLNDLTTPSQKPFLLSKAEVDMSVCDQEFSGGYITATERNQRIVDTWHRVSETLRKQVVEHFSTYDQLNPVYIMALSGARGNFSQVRQLVGMRGLMADPQGQIISFPIRSNLREGLTLTEYFISCSGARKGLVDTALRTADTGYLTRRLVDVSHHIVIKKICCNTKKGITVRSLKSENKVLLSLSDRLIGRVLAQNIKYSEVKQVVDSRPSKGVRRDFPTFLAQTNQEIDPPLAVKIQTVREQVKIRSPLTCALTHSVCQLCYGWSLSQGRLVSLGEAVGVIAAQSIGEPGTQLTMRTFHTGGVFSGDLLQEIRAPHSGKIEFSKASQGLMIRTTDGRIAFLTKTSGEIILKNNGIPSLPPMVVSNSVSLPNAKGNRNLQGFAFAKRFEQLENTYSNPFVNYTNYGITVLRWLFASSRGYKNFVGLAKASAYKNEVGLTKTELVQNRRWFSKNGVFAIKSEAFASKQIPNSFLQRFLHSEHNTNVRKPNVLLHRTIESNDQFFYQIKQQNLKIILFNEITKYCLLYNYNKLKRNTTLVNFSTNEIEQNSVLRQNLTVESREFCSQTLQSSDTINKQTYLPFQALSLLFVRQSEYVNKNQLLAQISILGEEGNQPIKSRQTIFAELSGKVFETQGAVSSKKFVKNLNKSSKSAETIVFKNELVNTVKGRTSNSIQPEKSAKLGFFHILANQIATTSVINDTLYNNYQTYKELNTNSFAYPNKNSSLAKQSFTRKEDVLQSKKLEAITTAENPIVRHSLTTESKDPIVMQSITTVSKDQSLMLSSENSDSSAVWNSSRQGLTNYCKKQSCYNPYNAQFFSSTHNKNLIVTLLRKIPKVKKSAFSASKEQIQTNLQYSTNLSSFTAFKHSEIYKQKRENSDCVFLQTIAQEGDLVDSDYKKCLS